MKQYYKNIIFVLITCVLYNCSGKKQLEKGDYASAVYKSISKLRNSPNNKKASTVLKQAYPLALSYAQEQIDIAKRSTHSFKWNTVVTNMQTMNSIADEISRCPAARNIITSPTRYDNELPHAKEKAAEECYAAGMESLQKGTRLHARDAYFHFIKADELVKGYKDTDSRISEAKILATLKVVLEQIPVGAGRLEISAQFFQNNVEAFINSLFSNKQFVQLYLPQEAEQKKINPDHIIRIQFDDFIVGNTNVIQKTTSVTSKESVAVGEHIDKDGVKHTVYNRVHADFTEFKKEVISKGLVDMRIIEFSTNKILVQNKMPGQFVWVTQWALFNGDDRALTQQQKNLTRQKEVPPPAPQDLFVEFTKPILSQITDRLSRFYAQY